MCVRVPPPPVSLHLAPKRGALLRFRPSCRAAHPTPLFIHAFKSLPLPSGGKEMLPGWMRAIKARTGKAGACLAGCTAWAWRWCEEYGPRCPRPSRSHPCPAQCITLLKESSGEKYC